MTRWDRISRSMNAWKGDITGGFGPGEMEAIMNRQRFVKNILKMENEWLAADLVQLARKDPVTAEVEITEILNNLCTPRGLHARVRRAEEKVNLIVKVDPRECEDR